MRHFHLPLVLIIFLCNSCVEPIHEFDKLPPGSWRGTLILSGTHQRMSPLVLEEDPYTIPKDVLPFTFKTCYDDTSLVITIFNGNEKIVLDDVRFGRDRKNARDTVYINFPIADAHIEAEYRENKMQGYWVVHYKEGYKVPFTAEFGEDYRFLEGEYENYSDFSGTWQVTFHEKDGSSYPAIAEFDQEESYVTGTFLTETGDYRYLAGRAVGKELFLSTFDGSHAYLFYAMQLSPDSLNGSFKSRIHYESYWEAVRTEGNLTAHDSLTRPTGEAVSISFPDTEGQIVSLSDEAYRDKPVILQIMGSWCPNCKDQVPLLKEIYKDYPDIKIISLAFERYPEAEKNQNTLIRVKDELDIPWKVLLAGSYRKDDASAALPFIDEVRSYPTLIFLDSDHKIQHISTGYYGPATSLHERHITELKEKAREIAEGI